MARFIAASVLVIPPIWLMLGGLRKLDDNEKESVDKLLNLAKFAIIAMMVIGGYMNQSLLLGLL